MAAHTNTPTTEQQFDLEGNPAVPLSITEATDEFLVTRDPVRWSPPAGFPGSLQPAGLFTQDAPSGLEVALAVTLRKPNALVMRRAWARRRAGRASPVLLLAFYPASTSADGARISLCGPSGEQPMVRHNLEVLRVERLVAVALGEPNHHAATRFLLAALAELDSPVPGLRNVGLLATHELRDGVPRMAEWSEAGRRSVPLLRERGKRLVERLGFRVEPLGTNTSMLTIEGAHRAIAVFCEEGEPFESPSTRFDGSSPVSRGLAAADRQNVDWVILTRASEIRLYAARRDTGVGRKGRAETFVEVNLALLHPEKAAYLHLLFSTEALREGGPLHQVLERSQRYAADLASRLQERVYFETVPALAEAIAARLDLDPDSDQLDEAYEQVMLILFRVLFVAYAEAKDLLPYSTNNYYRDNSLTRLAGLLQQDLLSGSARYDNRATSFWDQIRGLWDAVNKGHLGWGVPVYNGGLFSENPKVSRAGAALSNLSIPDAELVPALAALLIDKTPEGSGPVDFRALSVREFGTIYEGLLESRLAVAQKDLTVRRVKGQDTYVPAQPGDSVEVEAGTVYLHNRSGVRKATGSYFTKPFAVEHLLDAALEAALDNHIERLNRLRSRGAEGALANAFFDFRCADIAMGSGHFLVAALDRIEARLSAWLTENPVAPVTNELARLREAAMEALGEYGPGAAIESSSLIRRQVARHCVYGVDRNRIAVELARLAVWVHTFLPGLPLSFLDHNLVCGDSLTGIATLDEVMAEFEPNSDPAAPSLFRDQMEALLERSREALTRLARTSDASKREIDEAREAHLEAQEAVTGASSLFNVVVAHRAGVCRLPEDYSEETVIETNRIPEVVEQIERLDPVHFPTAFPEVFLRQRPGFDCVLGNPPWEKVKVEKQQWWGQHKPGIRALSVGKMNEVIDALRCSRPDLDDAYRRDMDEAKRLAALLRRTFDLGAGDTDLYQAFGWRFWYLTADGGTIGVVLPRQALAAPGCQKWRISILTDGAFADVTQLVNNGKWVFEDVHQQYTIALCAIRKGTTFAGRVAMRGPYSSRWAYSDGSVATGIEVEEFLSWSESAAFPLLPSEAALTTFRKLRSHPRLDRRVPSPESRVPSPESRVPSPESRVPSVTMGRSAVRRVALYGRQTPVHPRRWRVRPYRELDSANDKHRFILNAGRGTMNKGIWPVYTGRSFDLWNPDTRKYYASVDARTITTHLQDKRWRVHSNKKSVFSEFDPEHIADPSTLACLRPRLMFRDVTNRTNTRTVIAALVPGEVVSVDMAPSLLWPRGTARDEAYLLGVLSSMILDWYARRVVELHVKFYILNNFPIPDVDHDDDPIAARVVEIAGRLAAVDDRFSEWAAAVGVPVGSVADERTKLDLIYELDACVAHLYGLDESDLAVIYETFHENTDYSDRHATVLEYFRRIT